jgi:hypothetical protein
MSCGSSSCGREGELALTYPSPTYLDHTISRGQVNAMHADTPHGKYIQAQTALCWPTHHDSWDGVPYEEAPLGTSEEGKAVLADVRHECVRDQRAQID